MKRVWCNGSLVDADGLLTSDGWAMGSGIFETIKTSSSKIYALNRHMRRAIDAAQRIGVALPTEEEIRTGVREILKAEPYESGRLRLHFSNGSFIAVHDSYEAPQPLVRVGVYRDGVDGIEMKTFPYTHRTELLARAVADGFDEGLLCNKKGELTEGAVSNFLFHDGEVWFTTPLSAGVLPGVTRALFLDELEIQVRNLTLDELGSIERALLISSLRIAQTVTSLGDVVLKDDEITKEFSAQLHQVYESSSVGLEHV